MIDTLLTIELPHAYGLKRTNVQLICRQATGVFEVSDQVACTRCKTTEKFPERNNCNGQVMRVDAKDCIITVIDHEDYIKQFNGTQFSKGGTCDLMMFDANTFRKVVFCELGCYSDKHIEKKQNKSHKQVCDSLARFINRECGQFFIDQFEEKVLIFGRRDPAVNPEIVPTTGRGNVKGNMQAFLTNPFSNPKYATSSEIVEGVRVSFIIVNYPEPYIW